MRMVGIILVLLGALTLATEGFISSGGPRQEASFRPEAAEAIAPVRLPPTISGIALTTGLLIVLGVMKRRRPNPRPAWPGAWVGKALTP